MALMLDESESMQQPTFQEHLLDCEDCQREWRQLEGLEQFLRRQPIAAPSEHFASRVMAFVSAETRSLPPWQRSLVLVAAIASAVASLASGVVGVTHGFGLAERAPVWVALAASAGRSAISFLAAMGAILASGNQVWLVYIPLSVTLASLWFAALVLPRTSTERARSRRA
jgi:hypothetical protein